MNKCPLDYRFFDRTVTVYRKEGSQVLRKVIENTYLQWQSQQTEDTLGRRTQQKFLMILPGAVQSVLPGDWVMEGIGPELTSWRQVLEETSAAEVGYAEPYYWRGVLCHTEAGRK